MQGTFNAFTAVWRIREAEWPIWLVARSRAQAAVCAMVTFTVLEARLARDSQPE